MKNKSIIFICLFVFFINPSYSDEIKNISYGKHWLLQYNSGEVGKFCNVSTNWRTGDNFSIIAYSKTVNMMFFNSNWKIPENTKSSIVLKFDDKYQKNIDVVRISDQAMMYYGNTDVNLTRDIISLFAHSNNLLIYYPNGSSLRGALDSTYKAVEGWQKCANEWAGLPIKVLDVSVESHTIPNQNPDTPVKTENPTVTKSDETTKSEEISSGTGIIISNDGVIATNAHVVNNCSNISVQSGETVSEAKLLAADKNNDLAILRANGTFKNVSVFSDQLLDMGAKVTAFGFPLPGALSSGGNFTIGYVTGTTGLADDSRFIQISTPVQPGNSGGPLLDGKGKLAGMVTSKLNAIAVAKAVGDIPQNVNFAIRSQVLKYFLDVNHIKTSVPRDDKVKSDIELAEIGRNVSVFIKCTSRR